MPVINAIADQAKPASRPIDEETQLTIRKRKSDETKTSVKRPTAKQGNCVRAERKAKLCTRGTVSAPVESSMRTSKGRQAAANAIDASNKIERPA